MARAAPTICRARAAFASLWVLTLTMVVVMPLDLASADAKARTEKPQRARSGERVRKKSTVLKTKPKANKPTRRVKKRTKDTWEPTISDVFRATLALVVIALFWRWRRDAREDQDIELTTHGSPRYVGGPVHLTKNPGVDPHTLKQEHTLVPLGLGEAPRSMVTLGLDEDDPRSIAAEIDALTSHRGDEADFKLRGTSAPQGGNPKVKPTRPSKRPLELPGELGTHFAGFAGETLEWHATLGAKGGQVAITDRRLLAVYRKTAISFAPPNIEVHVRRHQHPVQSITELKTVRTRHPAFLAVAAVTVLFFPLGTIVASLAIGGYFGVTRSDLEVVTTTGRRRYPLSLIDQEPAKRAWHKMKSAPLPHVQDPSGRQAG